MGHRTILHADMNNFYASVECLYRPDIRGKPVAVAGDVEQRHGIVLAKNDLAKRFGIQTGNPLWLARKLCKDIVFIPPHYDRYQKFSRLAQEIYATYTDQVEPFGLDECWLDVSGSVGLFGDGKNIADELRSRIRRELGIAASIGVSFNKVFAKLGSDMRKPDATTVIPYEDFRTQVWPLPVSELLYVGKSTNNKLRRYGIDTIGTLAQSDPMLLRGILGKMGGMLWSFANGMDTSPVSHREAGTLIKSIGNSTTTPRDLITDEDIRMTLYILSDSVAARLRECDFVCHTVQISVRDNTLVSYQRQGKLSVPSCIAQEIFDKAFALYRDNRPDRPVRSLGVRACGLSVREVQQLSLLPEEMRRQKREQLERTTDALRRRFGAQCLRRGVMLSDLQLSAVNPKEDHVIHPVGFLQGAAMSEYSGRENV